MGRGRISRGTRFLTRSWIFDPLLIDIGVVLPYRGDHAPLRLWVDIPDHQVFGVEEVERETASPAIRGEHLW